MSEFYKPPLDQQGIPVKAAVLDVFKRAIFKIAVVFERVNLFINGRVRARSVTLEVVACVVKDSIDVFPDRNPFKLDDLRHSRLSLSDLESVEYKTDDNSEGRLSTN